MRQGALAAAYRYDAFGNTSVQDYIENITGNKKITENAPVNYSEPSGHGIKSKLKNTWGKVKSTASKAWNNVKTTASKAWNTVTKTASNLYSKAKTGLNNYMNSSSYQSYFKSTGSSGGGNRTGASTGNGYVGRNSGSGGNSGGGAGYRYSGGSSGGGYNGSGNTSYSYVRYNREPSYKLTIGGTTRYYHTEAERNTARKVCETADRINKGEKVVNPNPTAAAILATLAATTVVALTGGAAAPVVGAMGLEGFGAAVATTTISGTIGGATEAGLYSALMGNDANTVTEDAIKGGLLGGAIGAVAGTQKKIYLMAGDKIDRFGGTTGKYFSPLGTPMEMRALPYNADTSIYTQFEVIKSFEVEESTIAPAFGKIGLGTQYKSSVTVDVLLKRDIIKIIGEN